MRDQVTRLSAQRGQTNSASRCARINKALAHFEQLLSCTGKQNWHSDVLGYRTDLRHGPEKGRGKRK